MYKVKLKWFLRLKNCSFCNYRNCSPFFVLQKKILLLITFDWCSCTAGFFWCTFLSSITIRLYFTLSNKTFLFEHLFLNSLPLISPWHLILDFCCSMHFPLSSCSMYHSPWSPNVTPSIYLGQPVLSRPSLRSIFHIHTWQTQISIINTTCFSLFNSRVPAITDCDRLIVYSVIFTQLLHLVEWHVAVIWKKVNVGFLDC